MVLTASPESPTRDAPELLIEEARKRQRRRRRIVGSIVVAAIVVALALRWVDGSSGSTGSRPVASEANSQRASATQGYSECPATHNPKTGQGDALPPKGYTDEVNVRTVAIRSRDLLDSQFPGVTEVRVIPRNGEVWSYDAAGKVLIEQMADFEIEVRLESASDCPTGPWSWGGVPLRFVSPA